MKAARTAPKPAPADIPNVADHPAVAAVRHRHAALAAELAAVRSARAAVEADLGAEPGAPDEELEARLLAQGEQTEPVAQLREHRRREVVLTKALVLVAAELREATDKAAREYAGEVRERVFLPAAREAVAAWLAACATVERFRRLVGDIQAAGVGSGTYSPFNARVPLGLADPDDFGAFARELIHDGFATPADVNAALPGAV